MIYRLGIYDFRTKSWKGKPYTFVKNPSKVGKSRKHILTSSDTLAGYINHEWGLDQRKIVFQIKMPFQVGGFNVVREYADKFEKLLDTIIDSRYQRWIIGDKSELFVGFVDTYSHDRNADTPNAIQFSLNFLVDENIWDFNFESNELSKSMFGLFNFNVAKDYLTDRVDYVKGLLGE